MTEHCSFCLEPASINKAHRYPYDFGIVGGKRIRLCTAHWRLIREGAVITVPR